MGFQNLPIQRVNDRLSISGGTLLGPLSGTSISATTFYGDGSHLTGLNLDVNYVNVTGDTMTGQLNVPVISATTIYGNLIGDHNTFTTGATKVQGLDASNQKLVNVAAGEADSDGVNKKQVLDLIAALVDSSPSTLDTLKELATALGDDPNFATTVTNALGNKVDKITGKGLSTNDFTNTLKNKLDGIQSGAQVNVIETISVNGGTPVSPTNKNVDLTITNTSGTSTGGDLYLYQHY